MNELYRAIIQDLCKSITALLSLRHMTALPNTGEDEIEQEAITAAKKAVASAQAACAVAEYYRP